MNTIWYLLDDEGKPYPTSDTRAANELLGDIQKRRIALTEKKVAGHAIRLSTAFLVLDHDDFTGKPVLYESMLFIDGEEIGNATERYHTKEDALEGHQRIEDSIEQVLMQLGEQNIDMVQIKGLLG